MPRSFDSLTRRATVDSFNDVSSGLYYGFSPRSAITLEALQASTCYHSIGFSTVADLRLQVHSNGHSRLH